MSPLRALSILLVPTLMGVAIVTLSCKAEVLEFVMADAFKLRIPAQISNDQISSQLEDHERMARRNTLALREIDAPAILITGPEGLAFYFNPRNTPDLIRRSLFDMYPAKTVDNMMIGKFAGILSPDARLVFTGRSKEDAEALLSLDLKYVTRKAFAEAMNKAEVDRLLKLNDEKRRPLIDPLPTTFRIAQAREAAASDRGAFCRILAWCGL